MKTRIKDYYFIKSFDFFENVSMYNVLFNFIKKDGLNYEKN